MARTHYRSAYVCGLSAIAAALAAPVASADPPAPDPDVRASMQCDRATEPGRVRCTVEVRIDGARTISWADVEILSLPDFASALKGRIGPSDAVSRDPTSVRWGFGLVARRAGQGELRARIRLVACAVGSSTRCAPVTVDVKTQITVSG